MRRTQEENIAEAEELNRQITAEKLATSQRFKARAEEAKKTVAPPWAELAAVDKTIATLTAKETKQTAQITDLREQTKALEENRAATIAEIATCEDKRRLLRTRAAPFCADIEDPADPKGMHRWGWALDCDEIRANPHAEEVMMQLIRHYDKKLGKKGTRPDLCPTAMLGQADEEMAEARPSTPVIGTSPFRVLLSPGQEASPDREPPPGQEGPVTDDELRASVP